MFRLRILVQTLCGRNVPERRVARYIRHHRKHPPKTAASETAQFVHVPPTNPTPQSILDDGKYRASSSSAYVVDMTMRVIEKK